MSGQLLADSDEAVDNLLDPVYASILKSFPYFFRRQLLLEREERGSIALSRLETERLLEFLVGQELKKRKEAGSYKGSFAGVTHFFGYQGRSATPTIFDCTLGNTYGFISALLIDANVTAYMPTARGLTGPLAEWRLGAIPIMGMMGVKGMS